MSDKAAVAILSDIILIKKHAIKSDLSSSLAAELPQQLL